MRKGQLFLGAIDNPSPSCVDARHTAEIDNEGADAGSLINNFLRHYLQLKGRHKRPVTRKI